MRDKGHEEKQISTFHLALQKAVSDNMEWRSKHDTRTSQDRDADATESRARARDRENGTVHKFKFSVLGTASRSTKWISCAASKC